VRFLACLAAAAILAGTAIAAPGDPKRRLTPAGQAAARAALLRAADLPGSGWQTSVTDFDQPNPDCLVDRYSFSSLTAVGQAGTDFARPGEAITSTAQIFSTRSQALAAWNVILRPGFFLCVAEGLAAAIKRDGGPGAKVSVLSVTRRPAGTLREGSYFVSTILEVRSGKGAAALHYDQLGVRSGRTIGGVGLIRIDHSWPDALELGLARAMAGRVPAR
jgi:hypothetical protein